MRFFILLVSLLFVVCSPSLAFAAEGSWLSQKVGLSDADLAQVSVLILVAGPFVGNALARLLTRLGYVRAAAKVAQYTPFATNAASVALRAPTLGQAARAVIVEAKKEPTVDGPISNAAIFLRDFVEDDLMPIIEAADPPKPEKTDGGPTLPPGVANSLIALGFIFGLVVLTAVLGGCAAAQQIEEVADDSAEYMIAGATVANGAEPCFTERRDLKLEKCGDNSACKAAVEAEAAKYDDALATMRRIFCKYAPAEVCS